MDDADGAVFGKPSLARSLKQLLGAVIGIGANDTGANRVSDDATNGFKDLGHT
jgi:hypothetical protein